MGCDIHLFVEYKTRNTTNDWESVSNGKIIVNRNYYLFGCLCKGVRYLNEKAFKERGIPVDLPRLSSAWDDIYMLIDDEPEGPENTCTTSDAEKWGNQVITGEFGVKYTLNPDRHSHSYLSLKEFKAAIDLYVSIDMLHNRPHMIKAIIALMDSLESDGYETRVVFSFDN